MTPHIDRSIPFSPILHKAVRENRKDVTRRLAHAGKPCPYRVGMVLACVTHWAVCQSLNHQTPTQLASDILNAGMFTWHGSDIDSGKFRQARFFPRSLYHLAPLRRVVSVRTERLQEITEEDAVREGLVPCEIAGEEDLVYTVPDRVEYTREARIAYSWLIDSIQGAGVWASNPWVHRVELAPLEDK